MGFNIKWTNSNPIITYSGVVNYETIINSNNVIIGDARFDDMKYQVFDHSQVDKLVITQKELEMIGVLDKNSTVWNKKANPEDTKAAIIGLLKEMGINNNDLKEMVKSFNLEFYDDNRYEFYFFPGIPAYIETTRVVKITNLKDNH